MLDTPEITQTTVQLAAVIHLTIPRDRIQHEMGPAIGELMSAINAQGITPIGSVFSHHFKLDPQTFDFEVGIPVAVPVIPAGRVKPGQLPAATVAQTIYRGPYEGLGDAWCEFGTWIDANGHTPATNVWEFYVTGPESGLDPTKWRTSLHRPLVALT